MEWAVLGLNQAGTGREGGDRDHNGCDRVFVHTPARCARPRVPRGCLMSERAKTEGLLHRCGFLPLGDDVWYRWNNGLREAIHFCFDGDRLGAWSVWLNMRSKAPDQEPGRRQRLNEWLEADARFKEWVQGVVG